MGRHDDSVRRVREGVTSLDTDAALELIASGRRIGSELGLTVTVAVVDAAGHPVALARGKNWHGPYLAFGKARLAAAFRKPTAALLEQWKDRPLFAQSLTEVIPQGVTLNPGGYPIFDGDECIGALGVGGGSPEQDELVARRTAESYSGG
jgi:uncharacterized protein GlcG (DUF336 family)